MTEPATAPTPQAATNADDPAANTGASAAAPLGGAPDAGTTPDFKSSLGDFANDPAFEAFNDVGSLAKAYKDTKSMVGKKFGPPGDDATDADRTEFYKAMGVPDDAAGYNMTLPENIPEGMEGRVNEEALKGFAEISKKTNMTPTQAKDVREWHDEMQMAAFKAESEATKAEDEKFSKRMDEKWGDQRVAVTERATAEISAIDPEAAKYLSSAPGGLVAAVVEALENKHRQFANEDHTNRGETNQASSAEDIRAQMHVIMNSEEYKSPQAKGSDAHNAARAKSSELANRLSEIRSAKK